MVDALEIRLELWVGVDRLRAIAGSAHVLTDEVALHSPLQVFAEQVEVLRNNTQIFT